MKLQFILICSIINATAYAQTFVPAEQIFNCLDTVSLPSVALSKDAYLKNPAMNARRFNFSITDVYVYHNNSDRQQNGYIPWQGDGNIATGGGVESYLKVNKKLTAWGGASFCASHQWHVAWNSATDYLRVAPYVLADSVGGNLSAQQYKFSGGVGYNIGNWIVGAEADYRAEIVYRRRDPRVKDIVSDLRINLGASVSIGNWITGFSGGITVYHQDIDVDFYNPINDIRTYCMTGLGSVYPRFSGGNTSNSAYEGTGYFGSIQLSQKSYRGLKFSISGGKEGLTQRMRDYNNLDLSKSETYTLSSTILYAMPEIITFSADGGWIRRIGTENLFGTAVGNSYPKISSRQNYFADLAYGTFKLPIELSFDKKWKFNIVPGFTGAYLRQFVREPHRLLENSYLSPSLSAGTSWRISGACRLSMSVEGSRTFTNAIADCLDKIDPDTERGKLVIAETNILSSCITHLGSSLRCDFKIKSCPLFYIKGDYIWQRISRADASNKSWAISAGASF